MDQKRKFLFEETVPALVTWRCEIEADDEEDAKRMIYDGGHEDGPFIGDTLGTSTLTITPIGPQELSA
jgi:hypothetical protein